MGGGLWRSLRTRIVLLAIVTCVFLAIAVGSLVGLIRSSERATVRGATRHLGLVAEELAGAYASQVEGGYSLREVAPPLPGHGGPPPPPPPPKPPRAGEAPEPPAPPPADPLSQITARVLGKEEDIEGGFLAGAGPLVGYAFPTHEGPGGQQVMPQRERPTIDELAHTAEATGAAQSYTFEGSHDVVLFAAAPVRERVAGAQRITGAAWLMQRLPEINRGRSEQLLWVSVGSGAAALVTALLAWFVTVEVSGGVRAVTQRLGALEKDLGAAEEGSERPQLAEFERVLGGINAMAVSLGRRIANERRLEEQLRHRERLSSLGQFAAGVAHELRNPLATIRLRAQMSERASAEGLVGRNSRVILEEVDRLDAMIGRLLYFARPISLDLQRMDVGELCRGVAEAWQGRVGEDLRVRCAAENGVELVADRSRLLQVLDNLVENAVQASTETSGGDRGEVLIEARSEGEEVRIEVMDEGSGFAPEALRHAFDPFYTTKEAGTGLGLSIAFELVKAHGGELLAATRDGGGARVSIVLPAGRWRQEARA